MLYDVDTDAVRFTADELRRYRAAAAKNGFAVNQVKKGGEALDAAICGLPEHIAADMLQFLETGTSPFTEATSAADLQARSREAQSTTKPHQ